MQKIGIIEAAIILTNSISVAFGQERPQQHVGFGTGGGESQGVGDRSRVMDEGDFLRYLSAPETIMGEIVAIDYPAGKLYIDMGGSSHDERQSLTGSLNMLELWFDGKTNMQNIKAVNKGDYVSIQAVNETTDSQQFGTGKKIVRTVYVIEGTQVLGGADNEDFGGGFSQRPNPYKYRGIHTRTAGYTGVPEGGIQQGDVKSGITSTIGVVTGVAPCWQCAPQPDTINERTDKTIATDYGDGRDNFNKGTVQ